MISVAILIPINGSVRGVGTTIYGIHGFENDSTGCPDPLRPITTPGNDPGIPGQYDFWDHVDYIVNQVVENKMYISVHPTWGELISGSYEGMLPGDTVIFNETKAYKYGQWLGQRYGDKGNIIWMLGGDRSAIYDSKTKKFWNDAVQDFRALYRAMAEGLADGANGEDSHDGVADYSNIVISFHPRKWAPNSSEWFHNDPWLTFNSIQDTPEDQVESIPHDYNLAPIKPTWLFEGRYEGGITAWGVRYQAYQTMFSGAFGHTYGCEEIFNSPLDFKKLKVLPASQQMAHLYTIARVWEKIRNMMAWLVSMPIMGLIEKPVKFIQKGLFPTH